MKNTRVTTIRFALRAALNQTLEDAWMYLPDGSITPDTQVLIIKEMDDVESTESVASSLGFPLCGLDTQTLEGVALCAKQFENPPSDELLLESFIYYWRFDAWLPEPGAPEPPPPEVSILRQDSEFYDSLGAERVGTQCKTDGCTKGAVKYSVNCKQHHFEKVRGKPCPFMD